MLVNLFFMLWLGHKISIFIIYLSMNKPECIKHKKRSYCFPNIYYLRQGGNAFASFCLSVCLFVCLCVSKITRKVMDGSF